MADGILLRSFKERGARNTLELLTKVHTHTHTHTTTTTTTTTTNTQEQKKKGVIAASAGNHALALAHHGHELSIPVVVMMPEVAPLMKVRLLLTDLLTYCGQQRDMVSMTYKISESCFCHYCVHPLWCEVCISKFTLTLPHSPVPITLHSVLCVCLFAREHI